MNNVFGITIKKEIAIMLLGTEYGSCMIPVDNKLNNESICYCIGAGEDISFDCALVKLYAANVFIFDPTPRAKQHFELLGESLKKYIKMPINNSPSLYYDLSLEEYHNLTFYEYGIWNNTEIVQFYAPEKEEYVSHSIVNLKKRAATFEASCFRLSDLINKLKHSKINLLKLDVEGAEFEVIETIVDDKLNIDILYIEFHEVDDFINKTLKSVEKLESIGYKVVKILKRNILFIKEVE